VIGIPTATEAGNGGYSQRKPKAYRLSSTRTSASFEAWSAPSSYPAIEPTSEAWEDNKTFTQRLHFAFFSNPRKSVLFFQKTSVPLFRVNLVRVADERPKQIVRRFEPLVVLKIRSSPGFRR
jgi:hypothetical protein